MPSEVATLPCTEEKPRVCICVGAGASLIPHLGHISGG